jgi:hypothetical protein
LSGEINYPLELFAKSLGGLLVFSFVLYCILEGIQDLRKEEFMNAKFFRFYGLFIEILTFGFVLSVLKDPVDPGEFSGMILMLVILLLLIFVDIRKFWRGYSQRW